MCPALCPPRAGVLHGITWSSPATTGTHPLILDGDALRDTQSGAEEPFLANQEKARVPGGETEPSIGRFPRDTAGEVSGALGVVGNFLFRGVCLRRIAKR